MVVAEEFRINGFGKPFGHLLRTRPVHVFHKQVASHSPQLWVALQHLAHRCQSFLTLGCVAWASGCHYVVLADGWVVDRINDDVVSIADFPHWHGLIWINLCHICLAIFTDGSGDALSVIDLRDQINQLTCNVTNATCQVVTVMVRANVTLTLARKDSFSRPLVAALAKGRVVLTRCSLDVFRSACFGLQKTAGSHWGLGALGQWQGSTLAVCHVRIDFQIRPIGRVSGFPLVFVAFKLTTVTDERCFRRQGQHLSFLADPVVVHALGILGVTHKARHIQTAIDFKLIANNTDHGDPLASPFVLLKDFVPVDLAVPHTGAVSLT